MRGSPIDAVVLTGAEIDQIAGLLSLRESTPFTLYATPASHAAVAANAMFGAMTAMTRRAVNPGERFMLAGDIEASLFMVPGKLPLYLEGDDPETRHRKRCQRRHRTGARRRAHRVRAGRGGGDAGHARAIRARRRRSVRRHVVLRRRDACAAEPVRKPDAAWVTCRSTATDGSLRALDGLTARRIFVHINNTNPILIDGSAERRKVEAAGWQVAEDGMEIVL